MEAGYITGLFVVVLILAFVCVVGVVLFIKDRIANRKTDQYVQGNLNVYYDPDYGPQLLLQLDVPIEDIVGRKKATFNVRTIQYNSQK